MLLSPNLAVFCILSFEGPDRYSQAGGLGVRVTHLGETLAKRGFETHLLFVGDPAAPGLETRLNGRFTLHRWCQWISAHHPAGVYAAEEEKLWDFNHSVPHFVLNEIVRPAVENGRLPIILAEEWHTAEALIHLHDQLTEANLRQHAVLFWNANNTMSFHRVNWPRLNQAAQLTTVSRYMKHLMWNNGLNPLVIPNGIPADLLEPVDDEKVQALRQTLAPDPATVMLFKVGRFDLAKRWLMAIEAAAQLKAQGHSVVFPLRGGVEAHGWEALDRARQLGLSVVDVHAPNNGKEQPLQWSDLLAVLADVPLADVYNLRFFMTQELLRPFYAAADAVLANSGHEPFGLVGLEAMATSGLVFTGATGEEYSLNSEAAMVMDTDSPEEIVTQVQVLKTDPDRAAAMRQAAHRQAAAFTWERVTDVLLDKVQFVAQSTGALPGFNVPCQPSGQSKVQDVVIYTVVHQPRRLRLPAQPLPPGSSSQALADALFDEPLNEKYFRKVAAACYYPATERFQLLVERGLKLAVGFSLSFIRQAQQWDPELLDRFRRLVSHENVELVAVEPTHSFLLLWDIPHFMERMRYAANQLEQIFGVRPMVADTTELMMSDTIYHALDMAGFKGGFIDGRPWVMEWRESTHPYHHGSGNLKLLPRHYQLSDDVGYRFSDRNWKGWPLMADRYAQWLAETPGEVVVLGWDFETFGEHHHPDSGIFGFLQALPGEVHCAGLSFLTPSEAIERYGGHSHDLPLPAFASTWAGSGGLEFFLGNEAQKAVYQLMIQAYNKARLTGEPALIDLALWLAQSDNLHLIQWYGRSGSDAEVSAYFTPQEWWSLGPDGIIWQIQQVYKNFIAALDPHLLNKSDFNRAVSFKRKLKNGVKPAQLLTEILATEKASTMPVSA
ncbi:MAG: glycosyltransferase [Ardenticatenaceae bacterium]|nr:glycosyltransferase [Ardenticatenaceae bacterium]